ncbi:MAG TPA: ATP-binding protein [Rubrobacteraceae bacterium]|jgi:anti-sigma regulatory factor (Ser/Thr protein kinase)|nr:ATP-binding protein [Rubrobacteraceae bacterium]
MVAEIDLRLAPEPEVVTTARHALNQLTDLLPPEKLEDVRLVVSELVTNSILHAGLSADDQILLTVTVADGAVRGSVCDPGPGFGMPSEPSPRSDLRGGWGLPIVETISDRWGVEGNSHACVWFEID